MLRCYGVTCTPVLVPVLNPPTERVLVATQGLKGLFYYTKGFMEASAEYSYGSDGTYATLASIYSTTFFFFYKVWESRNVLNTK